MSNWIYADAKNKVVVRTAQDGSSESTLAETLAEEIVGGLVIAPFVPPDTTEDDILALEKQITPRRIREAILSKDTTFIASIDSAIAAKRKKP